MKADYYQNIFNYKNAMAQAKKLLESGVINKEEYSDIDTMMAEKYGISSCSIFREITGYISDTE